jgi:CRP/FNR family transcriptional regulator, dissimilatory nitrate respiration regulator
LPNVPKPSQLRTIAHPNRLRQKVVFRHIPEKYLGHQSFFQVAQLPPELKSAITYRDLQTGEFLFQQGEHCQAIFALESGQIRLQHFTEAGQQISHYAIYPGQYFAQPVLFTDDYLWTAIAEQPSRVVIIPKVAFLVALKHHADLALAFIAQLCCHLHRTTILLELRGMNSAQDRVINYLKYLITPPEQIVYLDRPLKEIASDLSLTPEALSRTLKQLQTEGVIIRSRRKIKILPPIKSFGKQA